MKPVPIVSVCMITYNHEAFIAKAIESVLFQKTSFSFELVIGDDCSTDTTRRICEAYKKQYPQIIRLLKKETNLGVSKNLIRSLKACNGKYIATLEGDDYWTDPLKLQKQVDLLEANPDYSMCFTDRSVVDEFGNIIKEKTVPDNKKHPLGAGDIIGSYTPPTQTVVFRRSYLDEEILINLRKVFNGDTFLFSIMAAKGKVGYIDNVTACYRLNDQGQYTNKNYLERLENKLYTLKVLDNYLNKDDRILLRRGIAITNQRLYVLYFSSKKWTKLWETLTYLLKNDFKYFNINLLKANKLLFKKLIDPNISITD